MHYYQFNVSDYKSHTEHLELLEDLAYRRMLDWCYLHEKPLPKNKDEIARIIRMRPHSDCIAVVLREFFAKNNDGEWIHKRVFLEIDRANAKSSKARDSAKARWDKVSSDANALRTDCDGNATQDTLHKTQDTLPKEKGAKRFAPPTEKEVGDYCLEKGYVIDPEYFISFYESKGWVVGKVKMKSWKAALTGWHKRNEKGNNNGSHQQNHKPSLAERVTENRIRAEQQIDEQSMGEDGSHIRS